MNDPGFDAPISDDARDIENQVRDEDAEKKEEEEAYLKPSRWWFASTAFPLIAGTFGPMASAFSICALVVHWRVYIPPGGSELNGIPIDDPPWLIGVNAAQLVIAITSNFFLLMNMAKRVRFSIAQPITIIGWYLSSFVLIGLCACASGPLVLLPRADHAFSQAFYYAVFSAGLYFMVATLMLITVYGAYAGHYDKDFKLTMSQRTLMLQTISFLVYLLLGALVYSKIEGWDYLDAVYWANVTLLTVGLGDFSPMTHLGRGLLFPFAIGGIIILGLVIGSIRSLVLERGKVKMNARMVEKERERVLKKLKKSEQSFLLHPFTDSNTNLPKFRDSSKSSNDVPETERERRQREFEFMRQIQERAQSRRQWTSLAVSGSVWLSLWFVGAAVFEQTEYGQDWTYFVSLYFSYTSLLTIGYGDFYPESNSGKPFFVFWSLLAIPSLTILISNMGDTVIKGVRDLTLWVGTFTVLPGEEGIKATLKASANSITKGKIFSDEVQESPPGILGEMRQRRNSDDDDQDNRREDPDSAAQRAAVDRASLEAARANEHGKDNDLLPESRAHYHLILVKEIGKVMKHLHSSPPRKYTFEEWCWYLKLIGEDESSPETHRKARRKPKVTDGTNLQSAMTERDVDGDGKVDRGEGLGLPWSWVGERSPLMGRKDESEWVLERLHRTLEIELHGLREEEMERQRDNGEDVEKMTDKRVKVKSDGGAQRVKTHEEKRGGHGVNW